VQAQINMKNKNLISTLLILAIFFAINLAIPKSSADENKQYRNGRIVFIGDKDYLIANNSQFVEILEITTDDKLIQVSRIHNLKKINDLSISREYGETYLIILTERNLVKCDISNPITPEIIIKRSMFEWKKGQHSIGYMKTLAINDNYIFAAGSKGTKRFVKNNLFVDKVYTYSKSFGVAATNEQLAVITANKGLIYDISTGDLLKEYSLENTEDNIRKPVFDYSGNILFAGDNKLIKASQGLVFSYYNPVRPGLVFSYASAVLPSGDIFYVNGFGVTKFNKDFQKQSFFYSAQPHIYGANSWAVGIDALGTGNGKRVAVFNKSSILFLDEEMNLLYQYHYAPSDNESQFSTELKITPTRYWGFAGEQINLKLFGFWPSEQVEVKLGSNSYLITVNNLGYGEVDITIPEMDKGITVISANGQNSKFNYQTTFEIK